MYTMYPICIEVSRHCMYGMVCIKVSLYCMYLIYMEVSPYGMVYNNVLLHCTSFFTRGNLPMCLYVSVESGR